MKTTENAVLQFLLGETRIDSDGGYYLLNVQDGGEEIQITVIYERTESDGDLHPTGPNVVFNETYSADTYGHNPFSIVQLSADLDAQNLHAVDQWVVEFAESKGWEAE